MSSDAAVALTTRMFDESAQGAPKAEALRRSMLALMVRTDKPHFAHPALWAPFVVVGRRECRMDGQALAPRFRCPVKNASISVHDARDARSR